MAKTIMISNEVYEDLKKAKDKESFSTLLKELINLRKEKTLEGLKEVAGLLKDDKEYYKIIRDIKKGWAKWTRGYA